MKTVRLRIQALELSIGASIIGIGFGGLLNIIIV